MNDIYTDFAPLYDYLLRHVDYDKWYSYLRTLMLRYIDNPGLILELGCGTGRFGAKFSRDNYTIFGMDRSLAMLNVAKVRAHNNFSIFCGDMMNFYCAQKFDFIFSVHDTMNYFLTYSALKKVFRSVRQIMDRQSVFMFDITTEHNIVRYFENKQMNHQLGEVSVEWSNRYNRSKKLVYSVLKFQRAGGASSVEKHVQRIYSVEEIERILRREGFDIIGVFGDYTFLPVRGDTVMINFVTRKG